MLRIIPFLAAVLGGFSIASQALLVGLMDRKLGTLESVFITYVGGGLLITLIMLCLQGGNLAAWRSVPWFALTAGALGLVIVGSIAFTTARLGIVSAFTVIVSSQFVFGALIDHFGLFGHIQQQMTASRAAGIGVLLLGIWLILRQ